MIKTILVIILTYAGMGSLSAQSFIGNINPYPVSTSSKVTSGDTVKILAVMVDFQQDKDAATFGNGKFGSIYSTEYGNTILDPLPHNRAYFDEHLEFVKNYYERVSNGKVIVKYTVLPNIITVSNRMRSYSPPNNSDDFSLLGSFVKEVWAKADTANPGFNFNNYNLFTIFHAGVGRDISLPGSLGDQKDLPSVYLGLNAFQKIYGENFSGFPVSGNSFNIKNTMILPETESREMSTYGGTVLFQITINGLLVASVASHLGLPDLFDTKTGNSAIGRFGLMDGQSIFAYNGLFPPEPSAWEKIKLGWAKPVTLKPGKYNLSLITQIEASQSDTTILKIPINTSEYYLVENRIRDANKDGAILTYVLGGDTLKKTFEKDTTGFYSYQVDSVQGVVTNVDEYDWAIPGNGIVIWHIDDNIINSKIADNQINADLNHRGVYVEEADGIWDIGQTFTTIFGDKVIGDGAPEDFWYKSNPSKFYMNKFSEDTRPSSNTNSGANSLITISNFSDIANKMSFNVVFGDSIVKPIFANKLNLPGLQYKLNAVQLGNDYKFNLESTQNIYEIDDKGELVPGSSVPPNSNIIHKSASFYSNGVSYIVAVYDSVLDYHITTQSTNFRGSTNIHTMITSPPVLESIPSNSSVKVLIGTKNGLVKTFILNGANNPQFTGDDNTAEGKIEVNAIAVNGDYYTFAGQSSNTSNDVMVFDNKGKQFETKDGKLLQFAATEDQNGNKISILLLTNNTFVIVNGNQLLSKFQINSSNTINSFALADLKQDGHSYILFTNGNNIDAVNLNGSEADNFPFTDPQNIGFNGTPLAADFSGDNKSEVIASTKDGRLFAIDGGTGKVVSGFPVSTGSELAATPVVFEDNGKISLAAINDSSNFYAWNIGTTTGRMFWSEENGNAQNSASVPAASNNNSINDFFPKSRAYNYPNPVYGTETNIRYYVSENSKIDIKIFDISGDFVAELHNDAIGGMNNETKWNVNNIQSGVYIAHIEAQGVSGKTESNIIKIAVVK